MAMKSSYKSRKKEYYRPSCDLCQRKILNQCCIIIFNRYAPCNKISDIPDCIFELINLQSLDVSSNALTSIPSGIGKLRCLEKLQLSNNHIRRLPAGKYLPNKYFLMKMLLKLCNNGLTFRPKHLSSTGNILDEV